MYVISTKPVRMFPELKSIWCFDHYQTVLMYGGLISQDRPKVVPCAKYNRNHMLVATPFILKSLEQSMEKSDAQMT